MSHFKTRELTSYTCEEMGRLPEDPILKGPHGLMPAGGMIIFTLQKRKQIRKGWLPQSTQLARGRARSQEPGTFIPCPVCFPS